MAKKTSKSKTVKRDSIEVSCASDAAIERALAIEEAKRLEKLPPHERLKEIAKQRQHIQDSLLRVNFPSLRAIKHTNGVIMVVADDNAALKQAIEEANGVLGPAASNKDIMAYAEKNRVKTTMMSVRTFKRNFANVLRMCNGNAEVFGAGSGGGQLKDIYTEGKAAIQEAEKFWEKNNNVLTKEMRDFMNIGQTTDENLFTKIAGKDWKADIGLDIDTKKLLGF